MRQIITFPQRRGKLRQQGKGFWFVVFRLWLRGWRGPDAVDLLFVLVLFPRSLSRIISRKRTGKKMSMKDNTGTLG
jgi:hypothetical protein